MTSRLKLIFLGVMALAMAFGFAQLAFPGQKVYSFNRLHIFLFNVCAGWTLILWFTEQNRTLGKKPLVFFCLSCLFALSAFFNLYGLALLLALALIAVVESVRVARFGFFPWRILIPGVPVSEKFHQASLLIMTAGLLASAVAMANHQYLMLYDVPKLSLDIFFLGFSFPLSQMTFSVLYKNLAPSPARLTAVLKEAGFWVINLGVVTFFFFILAEWQGGEMGVSLTLLGGVLLVLGLHLVYAPPGQPKVFLASGLLFLVGTAISGIVYILLAIQGGDYGWGPFLLAVHVFLSLYGWNISGLVVMSRYRDFPLDLPMPGVVALHWAGVALAAPLGSEMPALAPTAVILFTLFLGMCFFASPLNKIRGRA